ncbi:uncharacterized protein LOC120327984 [Styela clava]
MGDVFQEKADRDLFFSSFGADIGSRLDQLRFEFEAIENGTILEEPETEIQQTEKKDTIDEATDGITLETKVQGEVEKNSSNDSSPTKEPKERSRMYSMTIQRAFSTVSLMTNFKSSFWKNRRGKNDKKSSPDSNGRTRRSSTSSTPEKNNNREVPIIKVNGGESEGRQTIYSTVPRPGKMVKRSKTMSPSKSQPIDELPNELETLERSESGNVFVPPVVVDGQLVYDYQYASPRDGSPVQKSPQYTGAKLRRRNSLSRFLRLRKSPHKSPKKEKKNTTPIKQLYEKTVLTASTEGLDVAGVKADNTPTKNTTEKGVNGTAKGDIKDTPPLANGATKSAPATPVKAT